MQSHYENPVGCKWVVKGTNKKGGGIVSRDRIEILRGIMYPLSVEVYSYGDKLPI